MRSLHVDLPAFPAKKNVDATIAVADAVSQISRLRASMPARSRRRDSEWYVQVSIFKSRQACRIDTPQSLRTPFTSSRLRTDLTRLGGSRPAASPCRVRGQPPACAAPRSHPLVASYATWFHIGGCAITYANLPPKIMPTGRDTCLHALQLNRMHAK